MVVIIQSEMIMISVMIMMKIMVTIRMIIRMIILMFMMMPVMFIVAMATVYNSELSRGPQTATCNMHANPATAFRTPLAESQHQFETAITGRNCGN